MSVCRECAWWKTKQNNVGPMCFMGKWSIIQAKGMIRLGKSFCYFLLFELLLFFKLFPWLRRIIPLIYIIADQGSEQNVPIVFDL